MPQGAAKHGTTNGGKPHTMNNHEFIDCLTDIGWTMRGLATRLEVEETNVRRWASGRLPVPKAVATWMKALAREHRRYPAPRISTRFNPA
jgi:hypothetical protein